MYNPFMQRGAMVDYYEVLGVSKDASLKDINTAYKRLALKFHPDKARGEDGSADEFRKIQQAIEILRDPSRREKHDNELGYTIRRTTWTDELFGEGYNGWRPYQNTLFNLSNFYDRYMYTYGNSVHMNPNSKEAAEERAWYDGISQWTTKKGNREEAMQERVKRDEKEERKMGWGWSFEDDVGDGDEQLPGDCYEPYGYGNEEEEEEMPAAEDDPVPVASAANDNKAEDEVADERGNFDETVFEGEGSAENLTMDGEPEGPKLTDTENANHDEHVEGEDESVSDLLGDEVPELSPQSEENVYAGGIDQKNEFGFPPDNASVQSEGTEGSFNAAAEEFDQDIDSEYCTEGEGFENGIGEVLEDCDQDQDTAFGFNNYSVEPENPIHDENLQGGSQDSVLGDEEGDAQNELGSDLLGTEEYESASLASLSQYSVDYFGDEPYLEQDGRDGGVNLEKEYANLNSSSSSSSDNNNGHDDGHSDIFYDSKEIISDARFSISSKIININKSISDNIDNDDNDYKKATSTALEPFIPFLKYKLDHPSARYTLNDLHIELKGIMLECLRGYLEKIRLTRPPSSESGTTGENKGCSHLGLWQKEFGLDECEACQRWMPICVLRCPGCGIRACMSCKFIGSGNGGGDGIRVDT